MFRSFNRVAYCCRIIDLFALTAALTLISAHLDEHHKQRQQQGTVIASANVLRHQRNGDLAILEQVLENMDGISKLNNDVFSERSCRLLRRLLAIEANTAEGKSSHIGQEPFSPVLPVMEQHPNLISDDGRSFRVSVPYFGTVRIASDGVVSVEKVHQVPKLAQMKDREGLDALDPFKQSHEVPSTSWLYLEPQQALSPGFPPATNNTSPYQSQYPSLEEDVDGWILQLVDTTPLTSSFPVHGDGSI